MSNKHFSGMGVAVLALCLYGCASPERVVLLPEADGSPSSIVVRSKAGGGEAAIDRPYAAAVLAGREIKMEQMDVASVSLRYKAVLEALPVRARSYTLNFEFGNALLTADSRMLLETILLEMSQLPAPEIVVIGHTDDVGTDAINDKLSLERANSVLRQIRAKGVAVRDATAVGRGKRDPLYAARSGVAEPRNRRVEIRIK